MGLSGHASGEAVIGVTIVLTAVAGLAVAARLCARAMVVHNVGVDDGFIVAALLFSIVTTITMCLQVKWGMGRRLDTLTLHEAVESQKPFYISVWVYNLSISCTKFSILLQYLRIFPQVGFRRACHVMIGVVAIYTCWTFFSAIFACWPISYFWTQVADPRGGLCLNRFAVWFANAGMNIATDIVVGLLPMRVLKELELPRRQKIALMVVFALGGFTCIVSILRLESLYVISKAKDVTWVNPLAAIWSSVEVNTGILCSCLPTLRSCVSRFFPKFLDNARSDNGEEPKTQESCDVSSGTLTSAPPPQIPMPAPVMPSRRRKMSFDALGRGLTGRSEAVQHSYAYSGADSSSEEHELEAISSPAADLGQIQVTTTVEQDFESIGIEDDNLSRLARFGRSMRSVSLVAPG